jgi:Zn-dependent protease
MSPLDWSLPLPRVFGITIRVQWLFPVIALGFILNAHFAKIDGKPPPEGKWLDATVLMLLLFGSVLLHELGHCFAARGVGGEAHEVLLWPLGGLAQVEVPPRPRAHFLVAAAGPAVNLGLCLICALLLLVAWDRPLQPPWVPLPTGFPWREGDKVALLAWSGAQEHVAAYSTADWLAKTFWVNYFLFAINVVLAGFPLDGGRMLQAGLWPWLGQRRATFVVVMTGFLGVVVVVGLYAIIVDSTLALCLALFVGFCCYRQWDALENGGEESVFGYDFSQGYTSLERDQQPAAPPARKVGWFRAWLQRRAERRRQREQEALESEDRRFDDLLDKISRQGMGALTEEERRFMQRVSERYRNRH